MFITAKNSFIVTFITPSAAVAAGTQAVWFCHPPSQVVQGLVHRLLDYGVPEEQIIGIRNGLRGFFEPRLKPVSALFQHSYQDGPEWFSSSFH